MFNKDFSYPEVIMVEASAGAGKTSCLAKRYLSLLFREDRKMPFRSILALTFTNKATAEMKERILSLLKSLAFDNFSSPREREEVLAAINCSSKQAQERAYFLMEEIIENYNFFNVYTIDSFINTILLGCALYIDRSCCFSIKTNYLSFLQYALERFIKECETNQDYLKIMEEFLEHYLFVENRSGWFPKKNILKFMEVLFKLTNKYGKRFTFSKRYSRDIVKNKRIFFHKVRELLKQLPDSLNKNTRRCLEKFVEKGEDFSLGDIPVVFKKPHLSLNKNEILTKTLQRKWHNLHRQCLCLIEDDAYLAFNPYLKLFSDILYFFSYRCRREDVIFLEELNHKVRGLFKEEGLAVAEVYWRLAMNFKHYLIDEFQDTSFLQWDNLKTMVSDALSRGGSLFYVGDKKQAIYRFRGGEAKLFDEVLRDFAIYNPRKYILKKNWRSQKEVVEFNNRIFSSHNLKNAFTYFKERGDLKSEDIDEIISVFSDARQSWQEDNLYGYVEVQRIKETNKQQQELAKKEHLLTLIKDLRKRFTDKEIAILCRSNKEVEVASSWLLEDGIAVESEKTLSLKENHLIREVISFLGFLHSPVDNLTFASFILGEIFIKTCGLDKDKITYEIFNWANSAYKEIALYRYFRQIYPKIWQEYIEKFFKTAGLVSPYEVVAEFYSQFNVFSNFRDYQGFFMKLLDLIKLKEEEGIITLGDFVEYFNTSFDEDMYVGTSESKAVKCLTIHKAKGLEFGVVIVPFLSFNPTPSEVTGAVNAYLHGEEKENSLGILRISQKHKIFSSSLDNIYRQAYKRACIDELNNIYVAFTRPKYELYIFLSEKVNGKVNKAKFFIPQDFHTAGKKHNYKKKSSPETTPEKALKGLCSDWFKFLREEFPSDYLLKNRQKVQEGEVFHYFLSSIPNIEDFKFCEQILEAAARQVKIKFPWLDDTFPYKEKIKEIITSPELKKFFSSPQGEVFTEKEIASGDGRLKRIDRLIVKKDEVWVLDYKLSNQKELDYFKQVKEYLSLISGIYPHKKVRGFLLYLDTQQVEEVSLP